VFKPSDPWSSIRWLLVKNVSGEKIEPFSLLRVVRQPDGGVIEVDKPDTDGEADLVSGPVAIGTDDGSEKGQATRDTPIPVRYSTRTGSGSGPDSFSGSGGEEGCGADENGFDPTGPTDAEDGWGPVAGSWALHRGGKGWSVLGGASNCLVMAVRESGGGGGDTVKVIVTGPGFCPKGDWLIPCGGSGVETLLCSDGSDSGIPADGTGNAGCPLISCVGPHELESCPDLTNDPCRPGGGNLTFCSYCFTAEGFCPYPYFEQNPVLGPPFCLPTQAMTDFLGNTSCVSCGTEATVTVVDAGGGFLGLSCTRTGSGGSGPPPCPPTDSGSGPGYLLSPGSVGPACRTDFYPGEIQEYDPQTGSYLSKERCWVQDMNGRALAVGERYLCDLDYPGIEVDGDLRRLFSTDRGVGEPCAGCRQEFDGSGGCSGSGAPADEGCHCGEHYSTRCGRCLPDGFDPSLTECPPPSHPDACGGCITCPTGTEYIGSPCFNCLPPCPFPTFRIGCGCSCPPIDCAPGQHFDPAGCGCVDDNCPPGQVYDGASRECIDATGG
jgi:hypothetical protein